MALPLGPEDASRSLIITAGPVGALALLPLAVCEYVATADAGPAVTALDTSPARSCVPAVDVELPRDVVVAVNPVADSACAETVYVSALCAHAMTAQSPVLRPGSDPNVTENVVSALASAPVTAAEIVNDPVPLRKANVRPNCVYFVPPVEVKLVVPLSLPVASYPYSQTLTVP